MSGINLSHLNCCLTETVLKNWLIGSTLCCHLWDFYLNLCWMCWIRILLVYQMPFRNPKAVLLKCVVSRPPAPALELVSSVDSLNPFQTYQVRIFRLRNLHLMNFIGGYVHTKLENFCLEVGSALTYLGCTIKISSRHTRLGFGFCTVSLWFEFYEEQS